MSAITPPVELPGLRSLSVKEYAQRIAAYGCSVDNHRPQCDQTIWVGNFFDGTNNNKERDKDRISKPVKRSHSNIVVLHDAYKNDPDANHFAYYIPGVGTPFPQIGEKTESAEGRAMAKGGEARLQWAMIQLYNALHWSVYKHNLVSPEEALKAVTSYFTLKNGWTWFSDKRRAYFKELEARLRRALGPAPKPKPVLVNLSVFGFSRGAAQARAFCNWIVMGCEAKDGGFEFCGVPIRFQFVGLFDTVASVGLADSSPVGGDGLMDWADGTMEIPAAVEQCVHYVAAHEIRQSFPLSSARSGASYPANCVEVVYPGSHSDVGGGYTPGSQGKAVGARSLLLSQVPLVQMYQEARKAGVPLMDVKSLDEAKRKDVITDLQISPLLASRFRDYAQWSQGRAARVEHLLNRHMRLYWRWRHGVAERFSSLNSYRQADAQDKEDLLASEGDFQRDMARAVERKRFADSLAPQDARTRSQMPYRMPSEWDLAALEEQGLRAQVPPTVAAFFDEHVHDSHASFYLAGPITDEDKAGKLRQAKAKQARGEKLNGFEQRLLRAEAQKAGDFPLMRDADTRDLRDMEGAAKGATIKLMSNTRRESGGHIRWRKVFDRS